MSTEQESPQSHDEQKDSEESEATESGNKAEEAQGE